MIVTFSQDVEKRLSCLPYWANAYLQVSSPLENVITTGIQIIQNRGHLKPMLVKQCHCAQQLIVASRSKELFILYLALVRLHLHCPVLDTPLQERCWETAASPEEKQRDEYMP